MFKYTFLLSIFAAVGSAQAMLNVHGDSRIKIEDTRRLRNLLNGTKIFRQPDEETLALINTIDNSKLALIIICHKYKKINQVNQK